MFTTSPAARRHRYWNCGASSKVRRERDISSPSFTRRAKSIPCRAALPTRNERAANSASAPKYRLRRACVAKPVFVDIDPHTYNMDPALIESALTSRTKAIMPVHQMGLPCDLPAILTVADKHHLPVIEDAACAIGSEIRMGARWERIGKP